jgi:hypothetical protein
MQFVKSIKMKSVADFLTSDYMKPYVEKTEDNKFLRGKPFKNYLLDEVLTQQNLRSKYSSAV